MNIKENKVKSIIKGRLQNNEKLNIQLNFTKSFQMMNYQINVSTEFSPRSPLRFSNKFMPKT